PAPPTTDISPLSLHDALPIFARDAGRSSELIDLLHRGVDGLRRAEDAPWVAKLYLLIAEIAEEDLGDLAIATNAAEKALTVEGEDRKSTRLNSSHVKISYAVF